MILLEGIEFAYVDSGFRLRVPELRVEAGERAALVGPSGSGKTTLLRLVAGLARPASGRVVTDGVDLGGLGDGELRAFRLRRVGLVFQEFALIDYLSVLDNVVLPFLVDGRLGPVGEARERGVALARRVGLGDRLRQSPDRLSQGERQRVAVCRSLITRPPLVLADEPTGNLDPHNKGRILDELVEFAAEQGATLVVVTHDRGLLPRFARVVDVAEFHGSELAAGGAG